MPTESFTRTETWEERARKLLEEFCQDLDAIGGIYYDPKGLPRPVGDPDWIDLGMTYVRTCRLLQRAPLLSPDHVDGENPDEA